MNPVPDQQLPQQNRIPAAPKAADRGCFESFDFFDDCRGYCSLQIIDMALLGGNINIVLVMLARNTAHSLVGSYYCAVVLVCVSRPMLLICRDCNTTLRYYLPFEHTQASTLAYCTEHRSHSVETINAQTGSVLVLTRNILCT